MGVETVLLVVLYLLGMRAVHGNMPQTTPPEQLALGETSGSLLRRGLSGFALAAGGLLITAPLLVVSAEAIAIESGVSKTFVGTMLVGLTTSFPEIAATVAAVRLGALDLAMGNIFGSCAFNMCVLFAMDVAYRGGPVLAQASPDNVITAQLAVLAIALGLIGILARPSRVASAWRIESVAICLVYVLAAGALAR